MTLTECVQDANYLCESEILPVLSSKWNHTLNRTLKMPLPPLPFLLCDSFCLKNTLLMFPCGIPFDCCGSGRSWCDEEFKNPEQAELAFAPWLRRKGAQGEAFPGEELPRPLPTFAALTRFSLWCASAGGSCRAARESTAVSRPWAWIWPHKSAVDL